MQGEPLSHSGIFLHISMSILPPFYGYVKYNNPLKKGGKNTCFLSRVFFPKRKSSSLMKPHRGAWRDADWRPRATLAGTAFQSKIGMGRALRNIILAALLAVGQLTALAAAASEPGENLQYRVALGFWQDVARVSLTLKPLGPGHYLAEFSGATRGVWRVVGNYLPERYQTEMIVRQGRLQPLVYREEFHKKGELVLREYRFDYRQNRLELWRRAGERPLVKRWEMALPEPVYDILSLCYNLRLGVFGSLTGGETVRVPAVPTPVPSELILRLGPETEQGRKVMLTVKDATGEGEPYYICFTPEWVPNLAWAHLGFGKLSGSLLDRRAIVKQGLLALPAVPGKLAEQGK